MNQDLLRLFIKLVNELCDPLPLDSSDNPHKQLIDEIEDTFVNMQHLINVMRPTQAAMDLKTLLDRQTDARKDMAEKLKDSVRKAWELIGDAADKLSEPSVQLSDHARVPLDPPVAAPDPMLCPPPQTVANTDMPSFYEERPITQILADIDQIVLDPSI